MTWTYVLLGSLMMIGALGNAAEIPSQDIIESLPNDDEPIANAAKPLLQLFEHDSLREPHADYFASNSNLGSAMGDEASSARVINSAWVLYKDDTYRGNQYVVESNVNSKGEYTQPSQWGGGHDDISSVRLLPQCSEGFTHVEPSQAVLEKNVKFIEEIVKGRPDADALREVLMRPAAGPEIVVYADNTYYGGYHIYTSAADFLGGMGDEISSVIVKNGVWVMYKDDTFRGGQYVVESDYANGDWGYYSYPDQWGGKHDEISSLRPVLQCS